MYVPKLFAHLANLGWLCGALSALVLTACGGGGLGKPIAQFPSRSELEAIAAEEAAPKVAFVTVSVDTWQLEVEVPEAGSSYPTDQVWDRELRLAATAASGVTASPALRCAAQETARFFTSEAGFPETGLRSYILARCGASASNAEILTLTGEVPDGLDGEELESQLADSRREFIQEAGKGFAGEVGAGFASGQGRYAHVIYRVQPAAEIQTVSQRIDGDHVEVRGKLAEHADAAVALATDGGHAFRFCEADRSVELPRFAFSCKASGGDEEVLVEILTKNMDRVLANTVSRVLFVADEAAGRTWVANRYEDIGDSKDAAGFRRGLLKALNQARKKAGAPALTLAKKQSELNTKLVSHLHDAVFKGEHADADVVALGLMAGWDVQGLIRDGGIYFGFEANRAHPGRWLTQALAAPLGRWVLLDPAMTQVAIGADLFEQEGMLGVVTTYAFFDAGHDADEEAVFDEIVKRRSAKGHSKAVRVPKTDVMREALRQVAAGELTTEEVLDDVMTRISESERVAVFGSVVETSSLQILEFTPQLIEAPTAEVEVGITHYRPPGGAWGQYVVLLILRDSGLETAQAIASSGSY